MEYNKAIVRSNKTLRYFKSFINKIPDLSGREKTVLLKRTNKITLKNIGQIFGVTEGRIRQIERNAIQKIKSKSHQLALFSQK